jgi:hypothetical protein
METDDRPCEKIGRIQTALTIHGLSHPYSARDLRDQVAQTERIGSGAGSIQREFRVCALSRGLVEDSIVNFSRVGLSFTFRSIEAAEAAQQTLNAGKNTEVKQLECGVAGIRLFNLPSSLSALGFICSPLPFSALRLRWGLFATIYVSGLCVRFALSNCSSAVKR